MISVGSFHDKTVAVMGLGKSGLSAVRSLNSSGAEVWAWDDAETPRNVAKAEGFKWLTFINAIGRHLEL